MIPISIVRSSLSVAHVSGYALESLENALMAHGLEGLRPASFNRNVARALKFAYKSGVLRSLRAKHERAVIIPMMGLQEALLFPWVYRREVIPVVFDCMPHQFNEWQKLFRRCRIDKAFFTARMVSDHFREAMPLGTWLWLPEAIDAHAYQHARDWDERSIDVLEFGRRYGRYHDAVTAGLQSESIAHVYEQARGELIFETRQSFVEGLARSKVSVCFPQSQTHPERFGNIETLTQRYLESMASGAIIVGQSPSELCELFGYDPVVAVDWNQPVQQLLDIVRQPERHAALRQRNLEVALSRGAWQQRGRELIGALRNLGYAIATDGQGVRMKGMLASSDDVLDS